jgi:hypothetical protein
LHGPYFALYWRADGKLRKRCIPLADADRLRSLCDMRRSVEMAARATIANSWQDLRSQRDLVRSAECSG